MPKQITRKTADDFGFSKEVNHAVFSMLEANQVNCVSVLVNGPCFQEDDIKRLIFYKKRLKTQLGLHINISEFSSTRNKVEKSILFKLNQNSLFWSGRHLFYLLNQLELAQEILKQVYLFKSYFGFLPDYYDSHLHVHQWPGLQGVFLKVLSKLNRKNPVFIRNTSYPFPRLIRKSFRFPISLTSKIFFLSIFGHFFKRNLKKQALETNSLFSGVNPFNKNIKYETVFEFYRTDQDQDQIFMTHPSTQKDPQDPIGIFRLEEYQFLQKQLPDTFPG